MHIVLATGPTQNRLPLLLSCYPGPRAIAMTVFAGDLCAYSIVSAESSWVKGVTAPAQQLHLFSASLCMPLLHTASM
jgi:hypothetical protein